MTESQCLKFMEAMLWYEGWGSINFEKEKERRKYYNELLTITQQKEQSKSQQRVTSISRVSSHIIVTVLRIGGGGGYLVRGGGGGVGVWGDWEVLQVNAPMFLQIMVISETFIFTDCIMKIGSGVRMTCALPASILSYLVFMWCF